MIRRQIKTRLPSMMIHTQSKVDKEAKALSRDVREKKKGRSKENRHVKEEKVNTGSKVQENNIKQLSNLPLIQYQIRVRK